ncbi:hypothetical protein [Mesorhizobium sp. SP-1A]|uniref:hypothetical protein n=1 Tax=Mesorhizobium sp. SP-1A TaxID=3077840 RepID=UPI0028F71C60|nr:hypothetical protein [Mesorhizobium sp. SP-1A]
MFSTKKISIAVLFASVISFPSFAASPVCTEKQWVPEKFTCKSGGANTLQTFDDFTAGSCTRTPGEYIDVVVACPPPPPPEGRWVNATVDKVTETYTQPSKDGPRTMTRTTYKVSTHAATCQAAGLKAAKFKDQYVCASGEARPYEGKDYGSINYKLGKWGGGGWAGNLTPTSGSRINCYGSGQKQDNDATDVVVAWFCQ